MKNILLKILTVFGTFIFSYSVTILFLIIPIDINILQHIAFHFDPPLLPATQVTSATHEAWRIVVFGSSHNVSSLFTLSEVSHLEDVHKILVDFFLLALGAIIIFFAVNKMSAKKGLFITAKNDTLLLIFFCALSVIFILIFPFFFEIFHRVLFPQGNYEFPADSVLIQIFPPTFWLIEFAVLQIGVFILLLIEKLRAAGSKKF